MLPSEDILKTVLREHDGEAPENVEAYISAIQASLSRPHEIPHFSKSSRPLSLVRFRALLQDTSFPAEVYLPAGAEVPQDGQMDWSKLQERWVGWAVEVPGEQSWSRSQPQSVDGVSSRLADLTLSGTPTSGSTSNPESSTGPASALPPVVKGKYPIPKRDYNGAVLKVYSDAAYRPASAYDVIGVVSATPLPAAYDGADDAELVMVPAIHALVPPTPAFEPSAPEAPTQAEAARTAAVEYIATALNGDVVAAELVLLALLAQPSSRPHGMPPLGTFALNLLRPAATSSTTTSSSSSLETVLSSLVPALHALPLSLNLLHATPFRPSSDGAHLSPGLLQLAPRTLLLIDEDPLGEGGALKENGLRNMQALNELVEQQVVGYEYPFMDAIRMEANVRVLVLSEGRSLLPVDVCVPVELTSAASSGASPSNTSSNPIQDLGPLRTYIAQHSSAAHAASLTIPEEIGTAIQDDFVAERKAAGPGSVEAAESRLKRRMKMARLLALSYDGNLTRELWARTVALDTEVERRLAAREAGRVERLRGAGRFAEFGRQEAGQERDGGVVEL